jgi:peptidoglycan/LPS O-acetylase OafA/YrhL
LFLAGTRFTHFYDREAWPCETFGYTLLALCCATLVSGVAMVASGGSRTGVTSLLAWTPLRSCGRYSYAMYVFHGLLYQLVGQPWLVRTFGNRPPEPAGLAYALVVVAISYVLGFCSYHLLEKHFLKLKQFFA